MVPSSIFHKVLRDENAYSQLLCNLMQRDQTFREKALALCFPGCQARYIGANALRREVSIGRHGRLDILVRTANMIGIIEVKVWANMQETQKGMKEVGYLAYLAEPSFAHLEKWMSFLIPADYPLILPQSQSNIAIHRVTFEDLGRLASAPGETGPFIAEFGALLSERFRTLMFTQEEVDMLFEKTFPLSLAIKFSRFIDQVQTEVSQKKSWTTGPETSDDEKGFYFYVDKKERLYFAAIVHEFMKDSGPVFVFGIDTDWEEKTPGITQAFTKIIPDPLVTDSWRYGWITKDQLLQPDPVRAVADRLIGVLAQMESSLQKDVC